MPVPLSERAASGCLGVEVNVDVVLGYQLVLPLKLGVAQGLDKRLGESQGYQKCRWAFKTIAAPRPLVRSGLSL